MEYMKRKKILKEYKKLYIECIKLKIHLKLSEEVENKFKTLVTDKPKVLTLKRY